MQGLHSNMAQITPYLAAEFESKLGTIKRGWSRDVDGSEPGFQVVETNGTTGSHLACFSTMGLGAYGHESTVSNKKVRQEIVIATSSFDDNSIAKVLFVLGRQILASRTPFLRGDLYRLPKNLCLYDRFDDVYLTLPVFLDEQAWELTSGEHNVAVCCALPVTSEEVALIRAVGWRPFEEALEDSGIDPWDPLRPSLKTY